MSVRSNATPCGSDGVGRPVNVCVPTPVTCTVVHESPIGFRGGLTAVAVKRNAAVGGVVFVNEELTVLNCGSESGQKFASSVAVPVAPAETTVSVVPIARAVAWQVQFGIGKTVGH